MSLIHKINGVPIDRIAYLVMKDGITHDVNVGSMMGAINMFGDGIKRFTFVNSRNNRVTIREDKIKEARQ